MAKKTAGEWKHEKKWKERGETFGKKMGSWGESFGKGAGAWGKGFGQGASCNSMNWWNFPFGIVGPAIGSAVFIVMVSVGAWIVNYIGIVLAVPLLNSLAAFVFARMDFLLGISLFFGYSDYVGKKVPWAIWGKPIVDAFAFVLFAWVSAKSFALIANHLGGAPVFSPVSQFLYANLAAVFAITLVLGYIFLLSSKAQSK